MNIIIGAIVTLGLFYLAFRATGAAITERASANAGGWAFVIFLAVGCVFAVTSWAYHFDCVPEQHFNATGIAFLASGFVAALIGAITDKPSSSEATASVSASALSGLSEAVERRVYAEYLRAADRAIAADSGSILGAGRTGGAHQMAAAASKSASKALEIVAWANNMNVDAVWTIVKKGEVGGWGTQNEGMSSTSDAETQRPISAPQTPTTNRNAPCPCGSGRRYKDCCGKLA